ncbi:MAG TPA: hypothetical protein VLU73_17590 [Methylococcaceae bacterium]|nr:hypothetical protein [Methylococcaceae bacterium]
MTSSPPAGLDDREALLGSVLPNGRSVTVITPTRIGFASCRGVDLTRWRGDFKAVSDGWFINLRDMESAERWSVSPQPPPVSKPGATKPHPAPALVSSTLGWRTIETPLEVCVATDDVELRRLTRKNRSRPRRCPDATGHVEVMFNHPAADAAPPAFPKLFVQTEWVAGRERGEGRAVPTKPRPGCMPAVLAPAPCSTKPIAPITSVGVMVLRGRGPCACWGLWGHAGNVLNPIFALRRVLELAPGDI